MTARFERLFEPMVLRILLLEDSDIDAELLETHLAAGPLTFEIERATSRVEFERLLKGEHDVILADYSLPDFDGLAALEIARGRRPQTPFIFVSGVVGEDFATNALLQGAVDYVTKRNLRRLHSAVARAVGEARERRRSQQIEADLRASEIGSRIALRAARLGSWEYHPQTGQLSWDQKCRAMFAVGPSVELDYPLFLSMLHADDRERIHQAIRRSTTQLASPDFAEQFRIVTPQGGSAWIESTGSAIFEDGLCQRFLGVVRDITSEKKAELALLDRTASLQASVEQQAMERHLLWQNSQDVLAVIGPDGKMRDVSPSWARTLGDKVDDVLGRPLLDWVHPDDAEATGATMARAKPTVSVQFENRLRHIDGSYRWFSWTITPDDNGVIYGNGRDTTEEKAAAERVRNVEEALRQSQKMEAIGQLTGGIAHDFNNLLAGIMGAIDVISRRISKQRYDDLDRFMEAAISSAQRAAALTQRLLAFSRRQTLDVRPVDVAAVITTMEDLLHRTLGENIELEVTSSTDLWRGLTDSNQLESAVLNLAINARDAMPGGGKLQIETANVLVGPGQHRGSLEDGEYVLVAVADNGEGMTEEVINKAFDPFFTTKPIGQGTGLGLSMVYGFVKQSGGHVNIVSQPGRGTRIELYLRRALAPLAEQQNIPPRDSRTWDGETVLVIEDDDAVRMLIVEVLQDLGVHVMEAEDARSALPHIEGDGRIDLIVSDVGLPGLNGRKLAEIAREKRQSVPILFVTGYADGVQDRDGFLGDGMDMLAKPFQNDELAARVNAMLT
ncbi:response regulator [Devosia submarina]|uniref:response regulator n=1 Tax=Devosia submarina TaxID=1173082 RepID=UPI000D34864D|nr:response regulator [Devosia submarina]